MEDSNHRTHHRFMNVEQAAQLLNLSPKTLYGLVSQRRIPYRKAGRRLLFLEAELIAWTEPPTRRNRNRPNV